MSKSKGRGIESSSRQKLLSRRTEPDYKYQFQADPLRSNTDNFYPGNGVKFTKRFSIKKKNLVRETVFDQRVIL